MNFRSILFNNYLFFLGLVFFFEISSVTDYRISITNSRIYPITVVIKHQFSLCNNTISIPGSGLHVNKACTPQPIVIDAGQTFLYEPPLGSALRQSTNVNVVIWDFAKDTLLEKNVPWGTVLTYPYPDFPYVEKDSNR